MIDAKSLRNALGSFATGVTIVTTNHDGRKVGLTANSFNSVSLDPPLVLWSLAKKSSNIEAFKAVDAFAVHILGADQEALSDQFATPGVDKFEGVEFKTGRAGIPLLTDCAARFECQTAYQYDGGDHIIFVGEVLNLEQSEKEPLLFHRGKYARKTSPNSDDGEGDHRDLNYLVARAYFMLTDGVRAEVSRLGLSQGDHYALSILMKGGPATLADVNAVLEASGWEWTKDDLQRLAEQDYITEEDSGRIALTKSGRETMIGLFAQAKAIEASAQKAFRTEELDQLRLLLSQLLEELSHHSGDASTQHLEVMNALQADQT
ncbi:flavin reductase family protein [Croceicoccus sp. F390]|uniref:Flavin reductase family protein n=1 Tax=Croceicoccus esteveae TaxID=3075597 RepID=A0ABU2ZI20_9SPHN|nr:flavin reductase family protein [Croceicoccus sp. F390]MDT0576249.1 flavin reductase family protein [Croceicoccus sp. F390]